MLPVVEFAENILKNPDPVDDTTADLICESFKVLYNLIHDIVPNKTDPSAHINDDEDRMYVMKVTQLVRLSLMHDVLSVDKQHDIHR